nr:MAG TPA: hypothetical protein [Caudoviricetes sp.]
MQYLPLHTISSIIRFSAVNRRNIVHFKRNEQAHNLKFIQEVTLFT